MKKIRMVMVVLIFIYSFNTLFNVNLFAAESSDNETDGAIPPKSEGRTIIVISDIHIPDSRGTKDGYAWFIANRQLLLNFFDYVLRRDDVDELVINGDLADQWLVPFNLYPDRQSGNDAFYRQWGKDNQDIVSKINEIAQKINVVYVPGNHDMYFEKHVFDEIFPDVVWNGEGTYDRLAPDKVASFGMGLYSPYGKVYIEHGHRYDVYNAPDPYYNPGHILPLGYFVTRLAATNIKTHPEVYEKPLSSEALTDQADELIYEIGWNVAIIALGGLNQKDDDILMDIDEYYDTTTLNKAFTLYNDFDWGKLQQLYGSFDVGEVESVLAGSGVAWLGGDYSLFAHWVYFNWGIANIVVFGHTHRAVIDNINGNIYANSGTFIDQKYVTEFEGQRNTGTFVEISNNSSGDTVTLWRYIGPEDQIEQIGTESLSYHNQ